MCATNKAITRTQYHSSTVNDLLVKLNGSKIFTKLGMRSAFHQIEIDQDARFITTFQSDICNDLKNLVWLKFRS